MGEGLSTPTEASRVHRRYPSASMPHGHADAKACGPGATDLHALNTLEPADPLTPGKLGTRTELTTGPATRPIDRLEQSGHVRRAADPADRRKVIAELIGRPAELDEAMTPPASRSPRSSAATPPTS
ncbi:MarR family transcriptional regulator [Streptomyces sp. NPDC057496]|uniref:MarR family transcriptional regulator n=1 Tax=Streptomyces sp. NPDC057496 TaxID=3346149 RepID=UPI00367DB06F